ncbi:MAG: LLM class F420-dependent oxidoreductase [Pseudomonadales bacterium]|nr:LLM class F420-dependent oxidoreductase [Pseudomonadales bacterium]
MKLGFQLGYWMANPYKGVEVVKAAEDYGYDSVWTGEAYGSDCVSPLAWVGAHTSKIKLGTSVMQLSARTPVCAAMTAMTLDHLSNGRFQLGVGVSGPQVVEGWYGQPFTRPLERTREWIDIFRQVIAREAPVEFQGKHYQLPNQNGMGLGKPLKSITHPLRKRIPLFLGAEGPKNVQLAAENCEGWLPMFYSPYCPEIFDESLKNKAADFEIAASVPIFIDNDLEAALFNVKTMLALYLGGMGARSENFHQNLMGRMGFGEEALHVQDLWYAGEKEKAIKAVPDKLADDISLCGPAERIRERVQAWHKSPVTTMLFMRTEDAEQDKQRLRQYAELILN